MTHTPEPMKLEWIKPSGKEDIYGIYIDRGGAKYPLAIIEFSPALGRDDLERLFRAAPELLKRLKDARAAIASLPDDALGIVTAGTERYHWYIKDELLHYIDVELANAEQPR